MEYPTILLLFCALLFASALAENPLNRFLTRGSKLPEHTISNNSKLLSGIKTNGSKLPESTVGNGSKIPEQRIVGGFDARRYQFPFVVSYQQLNGKHVCGGTILSKDWILTAAHCLVVLKPTDTKVVAGMLDQGEVHQDIQIVGVSQQIIHPYYPGGVQPAANDIGLIRLAWSLRWTTAVQPICVPMEGEDSYGYAWVAGWGYLSSSNPHPATRLQQAEMQLITINQCANDLVNIMGSYGPLNNDMMCGRGANTATEGICNGDSGGPLAQNGKVIGVSSWTVDPCGMFKAPSVYTKISHYIAFIRYYVPDFIMCYS